MTEYLFTSLAKKKKAGLPKPEKVSTHFTKSATTTSTLQKQQRVQAQRVQSPKVKPVVKPVRYQAKQQQRTQVQTPAYRNEDFQFVTNVDNIGVNILVTFQGTLIYQFLLPATDYDLWQRMNAWSQKYEYTKMKIDEGCFMHDVKLVHSVVKTVVNILNTLFFEAQKTVNRGANKRGHNQRKGEYNRW